MNERQFDREMTERMATFDLTALPQDAQVEAGPWQRLAEKLLWGVILTTLSLKFLYLDVILPSLGIIWLVQAFRPLRRENGWLRLCHGLVWFQCAAHLIEVAARGTLLREAASLAALKLPAAFAVEAVWMVFYFSLWRGLLAIARRAGKERPSAPGAAMLLVWYGALLALALLGVQIMNWFAAALILLLYFLILRSLRKTLHFFEENGYNLQPVPSRPGDRELTWLWLAAVTAVITLALLLGSRYPMDWQVRPADEQAGCEEITQQLCALGLPEEMAADLTGEELAALAGAERVLLGTREVFTTDDGGKLLCRSAAIQLPGDERWVLLQHFVWQEMPRRRGTESLKITLPYEEYVPNGLTYFAADEALPARVRLLYDEGESTFTASAELASTAAQSWLGDEYTTRCAAWSLPRQGTAARGYLLYGLYRLEDVSVVTVTDYVHNQRAVYPYMSARQYSAGGFWGDHPRFRTMQHQMYFGYDVM